MAASLTTILKLLGLASSARHTISIVRPWLRDRCQTGWDGLVGKFCQDTCRDPWMRQGLGGPSQPGKSSGPSHCVPFSKKKKKDVLKWPVPLVFWKGGLANHTCHLAKRTSPRTSLGPVKGVILIHTRVEGLW